MSFKQGKQKNLIKVLPIGGDVYASQGQTLLSVLLDNDIEISNSCGGMGSCGTCRVFIEEGEERLSQRTDLEVEMAEERGFVKSERLACQVEILGSCRIRIPQGSI